MKIAKRRTKKWSLAEIEARPGITTLEVMYACVLAMRHNGWEYGEMADWFNKQKDPQGRPKFLNQYGGPINERICQHTFERAEAIEKAKKKKKPVLLGHSKKSKCDPHREAILELRNQGKGYQEIVTAMAEKGVTISRSSLFRFLERIETPEQATG